MIVRTRSQAQDSVHERYVRASGILPPNVKRAAVDFLCSEPIGWTIRKVYRDSIPRGGHRIQTQSRLVRNRTIAMIYFGLYERAELQLVSQFLPNDLDVVELGASLGVNTCHIARKVDKSRRVISVEADPELASLAMATVQQNGYRDKVTLLQGAVSYGGEYRTEFVRSSDSLAGSTTRKASANESCIRVPVLTLSKLVSNYEIGEYSLVTDIEGAEVPMLLHDSDALRNCRMILIEMDACDHGGQHYSSDRIAALICSLGFEMMFRYGSCAVFERWCAN